jgi:hypothetical protein
MNTTTKTTKTNFAKHEKRIVAGELETVYGWLDAGVECRSLKLKVSKYAELSATKNCKHSVKTIADYVGAFVNALNKYDGNVEAMWKDYDAKYHYRNISDFRVWAKQFGQRANAKPEAKKFDAKKEAGKYTDAQLLAMYKVRFGK